jgi:photosystem II stability/assembly factor-like uncharacterized protein
MKKILLIIIFNCLLFITDCLSQWVLQTSGVISALYDIQFVDINTGWATGTNSVILKTTNGGLNWITQTSPLPPNRELNGIHMLNANTGFIGGWTNTFLKTTNGGENWIQFPGPSASYGSLNDIFFIDENTGWGCGFLGIIWKTTNGGLNWDSVNAGGGGPLNCIQFLNAQTGWVAGDVGYLRKTTNGGLNWFFQFFGTTSDFSYNSMCFVDINTGWVVGRYYSGVFRTTNSGVTWDTLAMLPLVRDLFFINQNTGWVGGQNGILYKTTSTGNNWSLQSVPVAGLFNDIFFINDTVGWAANYASIIHTINGGTVGIFPTSSSIPEKFNLFQNYPNPFNPDTKIKFEISQKTSAKIVIFDVLGKEVETLIDTDLNAGVYEINWNAENYSSGIYFYSLSVDNFIETKKMILNK